MTRIGVFGWGIVAPRSRNIEAFERHLASTESWLTPFDGFGPYNFLVGEPDFDFADYKPWIDERFPPSRFPQLVEKMDKPCQFAIGAFIQALGQNPGIEQVLHELGTRTHVYVGTGLAALGTTESVALHLHRAQRRWDRFWAAPERNAALARHLAGERGQLDAEPPADPAGVDEVDRDEAEDAWWHFWAARSDALHRFLGELREIEGLTVAGRRRERQDRPDQGEAAAAGAA